MRINSINQYSNNQVSINKKQYVYDKPSFKSNNVELIKNSFKNANNTSKKLMKIFLGLGMVLSLHGYCYMQINKVKEEMGYVEPLQRNFATKDDAINYAISQVMGPLKEENPYEKSVLLGFNNNKVISECRGDSNSVCNYPLSFIFMDKFNIKHPYISVHGHPEDSFRGRPVTSSFSYQDFKVFVKDENNIEDIVVNNEGRFCFFRKKEGFKEIPEEEMAKIEEEYKYAVKYSWANLIKVHKDGEVVHEFYDCQGMHAFWKKIADKYNLEYYTNYGVHEGIDAYEHYYYPDLPEPTDPTSHKDFKL